MTSSEIETLINDARCINCEIPQGMQLAVLIYLADLIATGGIAGGAGQIKYYTADPNAEGVVPDNQTLPAMAYSLSGSGDLYGWNPNTLTWV